GLLAPIVSRHPEATVIRFDAQRLARFGLHRPSATFHGRDILAPMAAELAAANCVPADLGPPADELVPSWVDEPTVDSTGVTGVIITIDHFGNLISNIDGPLISRFPQPLVQAG